MHYFARGAFISTARIIEKILAFLIIIIASRKLGSKNIGVFFYYFSLVSLFIPLMDMGFEKLLLQNWWTSSRSERNLLLGKLLSIKVLSGGIALVLLLIADYLINGNSANQMAVLAAFGAIFISEIGEMIRQPAHAENIASIDVLVPICSRLITFIIFLYFKESINFGYQLIYIYAVSNAIGTTISCLGLRGYRPKFSFKTSYKELWILAKSGIPFSFTHLFVMTSLYIDTVFIGYFKSMSDVGDYNAAYKVILAVAGLGGGVCYALFPMLSSNKDTRSRAKLFNQTLRLFIINFGTCMIGGIVLGAWIIEYLYKGKFAGAISVFQILCVLILFSSITNLAGQTLEAMGKQKIVMKINLIAALFNVIANLLLIPKFGIKGAAFTTITTECMILIIQMWYGKKYNVFHLEYCYLIRPLCFLVIIFFLYLSLPYIGEIGATYLGIASYKLWISLVCGVLYFVALFLGFKSFWLYGKFSKQGGYNENFDGK